MLISTITVVLLQIPFSNAHMSIFVPSMYNFDYSAGEPNVPIGPNLHGVSTWWFRGPQTRAAKPAGIVTEIIAGETLALEIACHVAWTSFGDRTTNDSDPTSACPQNPGAYHAGFDTAVVNDSNLSGCGLGISNVADINLVNFDNLVIFSVQQQCVKSRITEFEIPKELPSCTGAKCICAWFWLADSGIANFYMTGFDCSVTASPMALPIAFPKDPCHASDPSCSNVGAKRALYSYNTPTNTYWIDNADRPGYHDDWGFSDGAQNDIFVRNGNSSVTGRSSKYLGNFRPSDLLAPPPASSSSSITMVLATLISILNSDPFATGTAPASSLPIARATPYASANSPSHVSSPSTALPLSPLTRMSSHSYTSQSSSALTSSLSFDTISTLALASLSTTLPDSRTVQQCPRLTLTVTQTVIITASPSVNRDSITKHPLSSNNSPSMLRSIAPISTSKYDSLQPKNSSFIPPPPAPWSYPDASMYVGSSHNISNATSSDLKVSQNSAVTHSAAAESSGISRSQNSLAVLLSIVLIIVRFR